MLSVFLLYFLSVTTHAKFAAWVVNIPCTSVKLEVHSCERAEYTNLKKIQLKGSLVSGHIIETKAIKCSDKQVVDRKHYKKPSFDQKKFLVIDKSCKEVEKKIIHLRVGKNFCDTPGALEIKDCFYGHLESKYKMIITQFISR